MEISDSQHPWVAIPTKTENQSFFALNNGIDREIHRPRWDKRIYKGKWWILNYPELAIFPDY